MQEDGYHLRRLLVGERRRLTGAAVLMACTLLVVASTVEYLALSRVVAGSSTNPLFHVRQTFRLHPFWEGGPGQATWVYGYLLVLGLAGVHAYVNLGYLTGLVLALAPNVGVALWSIHGLDEYVGMTPTLVVDRVLPEGPLVATAGFVLGLALRVLLDPEDPSEPAGHATHDP